MPSTKRPGKRALYVELPEGLYEEFQEFVTERESTATVEATAALRRHMAYPPPLPIACPLPPVPRQATEPPPPPPLPGPPRKRGRPRKQSADG